MSALKQMLLSSLVGYGQGLGLGLGNSLGVRVSKLLDSNPNPNFTLIGNNTIQYNIV